MSENVKRLAPTVIVLKNLKPKERKSVVQILNKDQLRGLEGIAVNIVKNTVQLTPDQKEIRRKFRKPLRFLAFKRFLNREKKKLLQRGGFLGAILHVLASVLASVING